MTSSPAEPSMGHNLQNGPALQRKKTSYLVKVKCLQDVSIEQHLLPTPSPSRLLWLKYDFVCTSEGETTANLGRAKENRPCMPCYCLDAPPNFHHRQTFMYVQKPGKCVFYLLHFLMLLLYICYPISFIRLFHDFIVVSIILVTVFPFGHLLSDFIVNRE